MTRVINYETIDGPTLLPCGAFVSPRLRFARCQECYGRRSCHCARGTGMPCEGGQHLTPGAKRARGTGRINRGFVDINGNRRGIG